MFSTEELYGMDRDEYFSSATFNIDEYIVIVQHEISTLQANKERIQAIYRNIDKSHTQLMYEANLLMDIDKRIKRKQSKLKDLLR